MRHIAKSSELDDWEDDLAESILRHFAGFAKEVIAPINASGDREGAKLIDGKVHMPAGFQQAYTSLAEDGWQALTVPESFGGQGVSKVIAAGVSEIFSGANHSLQMVCNLVPGAVTTLLKFGTPEQQQQWIPKLASGEVLTTMCLTEAGAGSDLSAIRCKAQREGEHWKITGEKIFISGGDQDMSNGILHLVLARSGTSEDKLQGLSLFLCAAQPTLTVARIESKLGLHASPTCHMVFDEAVAELIGDEGGGLRAMFTLMNHARIDVALQGVAHAAQAADIAKRYALDRVQGRLTCGQPARLIDHPDVQQMLDEQRKLVHGARALCHLTLVELERNSRPALIEFLTPLCKIAGSEAGIRSADLAIQILGGYGYLTEYRVEQIWRDARITAIYEGANGIHAKSLVTRGLIQDGAVDGFIEFVEELVTDDTEVLEMLSGWKTRVEHLRCSKDVLVHATDFASETIALVQQAVWVRIEAMAHHHPAGESHLSLG